MCSLSFLSLLICFHFLLLSFESYDRTVALCLKKKNNKTQQQNLIQQQQESLEDVTMENNTSVIKINKREMEKK